jgi:hypothetical protein
VDKELVLRLHLQNFMMNSRKLPMKGVGSLKQVFKSEETAVFLLVHNCRINRVVLVVYTTAYKPKIYCLGDTINQI